MRVEGPEEEEGTEEPAQEEEEPVRPPVLAPVPPVLAAEPTNKPSATPHPFFFRRGGSFKVFTITPKTLNVKIVREYVFCINKKRVFP